MSAPYSYKTSLFNAFLLFTDGLTCESLALFEAKYKPDPLYGMGMFERQVYSDVPSVKQYFRPPEKTKIDQGDSGLSETIKHLLTERAKCKD